MLVGAADTPDNYELSSRQYELREPQSHLHVVVGGRRRSLVDLQRCQWLEYRPHGATADSHGLEFDHLGPVPTLSRRTLQTSHLLG